MYVAILSICIVVAAFVVQRFANQIDEQLNACGKGTFKDGVCECIHPYTGTHCEIIDCGYGKLVDSIFAYDTITTPKGPSGCECEAQYWGYNCANCTSKISAQCTGPCKDKYYGPRCDILCKSGTEHDEQGVEHREAGGTYNYFKDAHGFCLNYGDMKGTVKCREGRAGAHCQHECLDCVYGKCNLDDGSCDCFDGHFGNLCENTCPGRCSGLNGVCQEDGTCKCYDGFTGDDCSLECCVEGRGTELSSVHGTCLEGVGGCNCSKEVVPVDLPEELYSDTPFHGVGWEGSQCDCHENITCGGRGRCVEGGCECTGNFQGARCDICNDDKVGPFCQYDRWQCPNKENATGEFVAKNSRGDYGCKCNSGFTGDTCEECIASAYPKTSTDNAVKCTIIIPDSLCHSGTVNPNYDKTNDMCICNSNFDTETDCASCLIHWYGSGCDHYCTQSTQVDTSDCGSTGGVCSDSGPGCICPKGSTFSGTPTNGGTCVTCGGDGGCENGNCIEGRCRCDPNYYGDNCNITAPVSGGKICSGYSSVIVEESEAKCNLTADCLDESENAPVANQIVAHKATLYNRRDQMFCHRDDTPKGLKNIQGCCVDKNGDGFCDKNKLESTGNCTFYNAAGYPEDGEVVNDICNKRVLEDETNVFEWCLSKEKNCTMNGVCEDPELCKNRCDAGLSPAEWIKIWEWEHSRTMSDVMSESWKFASDFPDPYIFKAQYASASINDVCVAGEMYDVCRDYLIPDDANVFNMTHKFTDKWEPMPNYQKCTLKKVISVNVDGKAMIPIDPIHVGILETTEDNTAVFGRYSDEDAAYTGTVNHMIDSITVFGKGFTGSKKLTILIYDYESDICSDFVRKVGSHYDLCSQIKFYELDYDWGAFCKWRSSTQKSYELLEANSYCSGVTYFAYGDGSRLAADHPLARTSPVEECAARCLEGGYFYVSDYWSPAGCVCSTNCSSRVPFNRNTHSYRITSPTISFDDRCYHQSTVCTAGCDNYQEGCEGLPLLSEHPTPMPAPCDQHWDDFCENYMDYEHKEEGVCAYTECVCEGYGVGGPACDMQCPVPTGVDTELSCGSDLNMGKCIKDRGVIAFGVEQGMCDCYNGGNPVEGCTAKCEGEQDCSPVIDTPFSFEYSNCSALSDIDVSKTVVDLDGRFTCHVYLRDSTCNFFRGRCECATPFTAFTDEDKPIYVNPHSSYRIALMQGYEIDEYLPFTTYNGTRPDRAREAFDNFDPRFKCFKDLQHNVEVSCDWIRALKHFARGGSYRIGNCSHLAPGTDIEYQEPCNGHGFPQGGTCACDYAEEFETRSSGVGLSFEQPGLTETPWRGKACQFVCPGYDMKSMSSVCSGHGRCETDARCACDQGWTGYKCDLQCETEQKPLTCSGHGVCDERSIILRGDIVKQLNTSRCDDLPECNAANYVSGPCTNETMTLARDRVVKSGDSIYHMYYDAAMKISIYDTVQSSSVEFLSFNKSVTWTKIFDGECEGKKILMYMGNGDNSGSDYVKKCAEACLDTSRVPKSGSWSDIDTVLGFAVASNGSCYCESADSATCEQVGDTYERYDFNDPLYFNVRSGDFDGIRNPNINICSDFTLKKSYKEETSGGPVSLIMKDSYGDGWNGFLLSVDGTTYGNTFTHGTDQTKEISGLNGLIEVTRSEVGYYPSEVSFEIRCKEGDALMLSGVGSDRLWTFENTCPLQLTDAIKISHNSEVIATLTDIEEFSVTGASGVYTYSHITDSFIGGNLTVVDCSTMTRNVVLDDFSIEGTAVRHDYDFGSHIPFMSCQDRMNISREHPAHPLLPEMASVELPCNVFAQKTVITENGIDRDYFKSYRIMCGVCDCEEKSQTGNWTGYDCRTPALGFYRSDARSQCPGMTKDMTPCNGGGTCRWGSTDGLGIQIRSAATKCYCGDITDEATLETAPRSEYGVLVHASSHGTPLFYDEIDVFEKTLDDTCPSGTEPIKHAKDCRHQFKTDDPYSLIPSFQYCQLPGTPAPDQVRTLDTQTGSIDEIVFRCYESCIDGQKTSTGDTSDPLFWSKHTKEDITHFSVATAGSGVGTCTCYATNVDDCKDGDVYVPLTSTSNTISYRINHHSHPYDLTTGLSNTIHALSSLTMGTCQKTFGAEVFPDKVYGPTIKYKASSAVCEEAFELGNPNTVITPNKNTRMYSERLDETDSLYDRDPAQECANRCNAKGDYDGFMILSYISSGNINSCLCGKKCDTPQIGFPYFKMYTMRKVPDPYKTDNTQSICHPSPLELNNYKSDCSCKFGFTGNTCETPRMMCLWNGEETDGTECICNDPSGELNPKVSKYGCCTKGTYWDQDKYASFTPLSEFDPVPDNRFYQDAFLYVCKPPDTLLDYENDQKRIIDIHNYVANTDEYLLTKPAVCGDAPEKQLFTSVFQTLTSESPDTFTVTREDGDETRSIVIDKDTTILELKEGSEPKDQCASFCVSKNKGYKGFSIFTPKPEMVKTSDRRMTKDAGAPNVRCENDDRVPVYGDVEITQNSGISDQNPGIGVDDTFGPVVNACWAACTFRPRVSKNKVNGYADSRPQNFWDVYGPDDITYMYIFDMVGVDGPDAQGRCSCHTGDLDTCETVEAPTKNIEATGAAAHLSGDWYTAHTYKVVRGDTKCTCEPFIALMDNQEEFKDPLSYEDNEGWANALPRTTERYDIQFPVDIEAEAQNLECFENIDERVLKINKLSGTSHSISTTEVAYVDTKSARSSVDLTYEACYEECKHDDIYEYGFKPSDIRYVSKGTGLCLDPESPFSTSSTFTMQWQLDPYYYAFKDEMVKTVAWSPDGSKFVSGTDSSNLFMWNSRTTPYYIRNFKADGGEIKSVAWSPDGTRIASAAGKRIDLWDTRNIEHKWQKVASSVMQAVSFSPDGIFVAFAAGRAINICESEGGDNLSQITDIFGTVISSLAWSPDGSEIVSGSNDNAVRVWDRNTKVKRLELSGHTEDVRSVAWSPDGSKIASGSEDYTIKIWDSKTGTIIHTLSGHTSWVSSVSFSPVGSNIASGSYDETVRVWDSDTGDELTELNEHTNYVTSVAFSPDGLRIISGSDDKKVKVWSRSRYEDITTDWVPYDSTKPDTDILKIRITETLGGNCVPQEFVRNNSVWRWENTANEMYIRPSTYLDTISCYHANSNNDWKVLKTSSRLEYMYKHSDYHASIIANDASECYEHCRYRAGIRGFLFVDPSETVNPGRCICSANTENCASSGTASNSFTRYSISNDYMAEEFSESDKGTGNYCSSTDYQVQVYKPEYKSVNIESGEQTTTSGSHTASKAFDGNINTYSHTETDAIINWLKLTLEPGVRNLRQVKITNRNDCCFGRLGEFKIRWKSGVDWYDCGTYTHTVQGEKTFECVVDLNSDFTSDITDVMIEKTAVDYLHIAEVKIYSKGSTSNPGYDANSRKRACYDTCLNSDNTDIALDVSNSKTDFWDVFNRYDVTSMRVNPDDGTCWCYATPLDKDDCGSTWSSVQASDILYTRKPVPDIKTCTCYPAGNTQIINSLYNNIFQVSSTSTGTLMSVQKNPAVNPSPCNVNSYVALGDDIVGKECNCPIGEIQEAYIRVGYQGNTVPGVCNDYTSKIIGGFRTKDECETRCDNDEHCDSFSYYPGDPEGNPCRTAINCAGFEYKFEGLCNGGVKPDKTIGVVSDIKSCRDQCADYKGFAYSESYRNCVCEDNDMEGSKCNGGSTWGGSLSPKYTRYQHNYKPVSGGSTIYTRQILESSKGSYCATGESDLYTVSITDPRADVYACAQEATEQGMEVARGSVNGLTFTCHVSDTYYANPAVPEAGIIDCGDFKNTGGPQYILQAGMQRRVGISLAGASYQKKAIKDDLYNHWLYPSDTPEGCTESCDPYKYRHFQFSKRLKTCLCIKKEKSLLSLTGDQNDMDYEFYDFTHGLINSAHEMCYCEGFYLVDGKAKSCPAGKYSSKLTPCSAACTDCPRGLFSDTGASKCNSCPAGQIQASAISCSKCPAGKYAKAGDITCTDCAEGTYSLVSGVSQCDMCVIGKFQNPPGTGATTNNCQDCPNGWYQDNTAQLSCDECDAGKYSSTTGTSECTLCAIGKYLEVKGSTSQSQCKNCGNGRYQDQKGTISCKACQAGKYQSQVGKTACVACSAGKYQPSTGKTSCSNCAAGKKSGAGVTSCSNCSPGYYSGVGSSECKYCDKGQYQTASGKSSCTKCPISRTDGYHDNDGYSWGSNPGVGKRFTYPNTDRTKVDSCLYVQTYEYYLQNSNPSEGYNYDRVHCTYEGQSPKIRGWIQSKYVLRTCWTKKSSCNDILPARMFNYDLTETGRYVPWWRQCKPYHKGYRL